ncbi:hypothetical protein T265_10712 [Opisthorchis viverrini]|uniref:Uncharacterized protein n=1 Tax=Opisthorchis viverrini TaxID=6198 RepID=A0A074Z1I6_OPIVI|nr:hypothetical protein T265_10712 [Opisthorchis viverrini]KER20838.1 hypothetical protein T265_10712 [Opisthorchis viverrini]
MAVACHSHCSYTQLDTAAVGQKPLMAYDDGQHSSPGPVEHDGHTEVSAVPVGSNNRFATHSDCRDVPSTGIKIRYLTP